MALEKVDLIAHHLLEGFAHIDVKVAVGISFDLAAWRPTSVFQSSLCWRHAVGVTYAKQNRCLYLRGFAAREIADDIQSKARRSFISDMSP